MVTMLKRATLAALSFVAAGTALAQPTATTYQGQLIQNGAPANGAHAFVFRLCSTAAAPGGVLQTFPTAGTLPISVSNGLFTQELTFEAANFSGADRWLEIQADGV